MGRPNLASPDEVNALLLARLEAMVTELFPEAKADKHGWHVGSLAGEAGESLVIERRGPRAGWWLDRSDREARGRRPLGLWCAVLQHRGLGFMEALDQAREWLGLPTLKAVKHDEQRAARDAEQRAELEATQRQLLESLVGRLRPIEQTVVETYLRSRRLELPDDGHALRYLPAEGRHPWPAMVGLISDAKDAATIMSLHFTRLAPDGSGKATIERPKIVLKGLPIGGGVIRLTHDAEVDDRLAVAEGIETALAVRTAFLRGGHLAPALWAAISAGNLARLPVLPGIEALTIYADKGEAGEKAAAELAARWRAAGREAFVSIATHDDWNS